MTCERIGEIDRLWLIREGGGEAEAFDRRKLIRAGTVQMVVLISSEISINRGGTCTAGCSSSTSAGRDAKITVSGEEGASEGDRSLIGEGGFISSISVTNPVCGGGGSKMTVSGDDGA